MSILNAGSFDAQLRLPLGQVTEDSPARVEHAGLLRKVCSGLVITKTLLLRYVRCMLYLIERVNILKMLSDKG